MSSSATIIEFDRFRKIRAALSSMVRPEALEKSQPKVDWYLPGFTGKSRIGTAFGDLPIEALRQRDDLRTYSGATVRVQLVDRIHLDEEFLRSHQSARPLLIPANSFAPGKPMQDMALSPGQEICTDSHVATHFLKAKDLRGRFNVDLTHSAGLTYYRVQCAEPTIVRVDGIWVRLNP